MSTYEVKYTIGNSGDPIIEQITTTSAENAKQLVINKYPGQIVHVWEVVRIS